MVEAKLNEEDSAAAALGAACALLEGAGAGAGAGEAEAWAARLGERAARDEALNVGGMLQAAAGERGARLGARLAAGGAAAAALRARAERYEAQLRGAAGAVEARSGAAAVERGSRALLQRLQDLLAALDGGGGGDEPDEELELGSPGGRARALRAARALQAALAEGEAAGAAGAGWAARLRAVSERLARLRRARERLAAALARHLNNLLIHLGNEAAAREPAPPPPPPYAAPPHHAPLLPYAPFMLWLKECDDKTYDGLVKVYVSCWSRVYERELRAAAEAARAQLAAATAAPAATAVPADEPLDQVLALVEACCGAEAEFCEIFFCVGGAGGAGGAGGEAQARRLQQELFPQLQHELLALVDHMDRADPYGAMRALAAVGRRVLREDGAAGAAGAGAGAAGAALAAALVAAKRAADRGVAARQHALADAVRAAQRRGKCGLLPSLHDFEQWSARCEAVFSRGGRRADLERWYVQLAGALLDSIAGATHPRTPRAVLQLENYHRLHALLAAARVPALDQHRRTARARYSEALRAYVGASFGRPLERLAVFFEGVSEAVAAGAREHEVCFRQAFSKQELKKVLALYPAHEVRKSLHRLYRTVEKQLSDEGGLLQVVWRALQEEFLAQHRALQARIAACYPGSGLALPLSTEDILAAFSDIAREH